MNTTRVAILIATFRRAAGLERALRSVAAQRRSFEQAGVTTSIAIRAVVANNDPADPAPDEITTRVARETGLDITLVAEAARGPAHARNRALREAHGSCDAIAFLDDDEEATPGWIAALLATKARFGADVVTGGIVPCFEPPPGHAAPTSWTPPSWAVDGRFFARPERATGSTRPWAFTGNVLFDAALLDRLPTWFDGRFMQGEDRHFFARLAATGARIVWCAEEPPVEHVPASRVESPWLSRRMRAIGRSVTAIERDTPRAPFARTRNLAKGVAWCAIALVEWVAGGIVALFTRSPVRLFTALMHLSYGVGLIEGALGGTGAPSAGTSGSSGVSGFSGRSGVSGGGSSPRS